jgi:hypothetical protein
MDSFGSQEKPYVHNKLAGFHYVCGFSQLVEELLAHHERISPTDFNDHVSDYKGNPVTGPEGPIG